MLTDGGNVEPTTFEGIASESFASLDGTGAPDGTPAAAEPAPAAAETPAAAAQPEAGEEGVTPAAADDGDFLTASGVSLEEMLEGVTDEAQRSFIERKYKEMQAHFSRRTAELSQRDKQAQGVASENEELRARLAELEARVTGVQPQPQPQGEAGDWRQRFVKAGFENEVTVEEAITDPQKLLALIRQEATFAARENDLVVLDAFDKRVSTVEGATFEAVQRASAQKVDALFEPYSEYRTPANENAMASLIDSNPALTLEQAFEIVVGPQLREETARFGHRLGEIAERKRRASVPSSGAPGNTGVVLPEKPKSLDEIIAYAQASANEG